MTNLPPRQQKKTSKKRDNAIPLTSFAPSSTPMAAKKRPRYDNTSRHTTPTPPPENVRENDLEQDDFNCSELSQTDRNETLQYTVPTFNSFSLLEKDVEENPTEQTNADNHEDEEDKTSKSPRKKRYQTKGITTDSHWKYCEPRDGCVTCLNFPHEKRIRELMYMCSELHHAKHEHVHK